MSTQRGVLAPFFERLRTADECVLMLDYDGTLAPFRIEPRNALPYPGICELIDAVRKDTRTRVVIISGRWIRDLIPLIALRTFPELWGSHGRERLLADGRYRFIEIPLHTLHALFRADAWETSLRNLGARVERKPSSLAVHWRGLSAARVDRIREFVLKQWEVLDARGGLELKVFDGGIEIVAGGCSKATAVNTVLGECSADVVAAYLGDDLTDEDALRTIRGRGLGVLVAPAFRQTAATAWLRPPDEVRAFLSEWIRVRGSASACN